MSLLALGISGCAPYPAISYASRHQMSVAEFEGADFRHVVITKPASPPVTRLHVYIEGDGIPWTGSRPSVDPSPRNALALRLAAQDPNDTAYIGRPCYFGEFRDARCRPRYWTSHRYGEEVLASMAAAIKIVRKPSHAEIVLIGYSGGGTLAALLESRVPDVVAVVSVAANLDIDAWTDHHGYDRLTGSLNPILKARELKAPHLQLVGKLDTKVPPVTSVGYARSQPDVELIEFETFDHVCCWEDVWPEVLSRVAGSIEPDAAPAADPKAAIPNIK